MRAEAIDYRSSDVDERISEDQAERGSLMTPARRAGLEALEREFQEFLKSRER